MQLSMVYCLWVRSEISDLRFQIFKLRRQSFLCLVNDHVKRGWISNGDFRKRLAIEFHVCFLESVDQLAVTKSSHAASGVDSRDPQSAKFTLANFSIAVSIDASANKSLFDCAEKITASTAVSFCSFEKSFFGSVTSSTFCSSHFFPSVR